MTLLLDAHIPPALAVWITQEFDIKCYSFEYLQWNSIKDIQAFFKAREMNAVIVSKDDDFVKILEREKSPPKVLWLTCGNTSKANLKIIFKQHLVTALSLLNDNDLVEISGM